MLEYLTECPLCSSNQLQNHLEVMDHAVSKETFQIMSCDSCTLLFTNPRPVEQDIAPYYDFAEYYSHSDEKKDLISKIYQQVKSISIQRKLKQIQSLKESGKLLDYGCGTGEFIFQAQNRGWKVSGVEPNPKARKAAAAKMPRSIHPDLSSIPETTTFDVITLYHVCEHIHTLQQTMLQLSSRLNPNGLLLVAVPNPLSPDARKYAETWTGWDVPRHLYHFTPQSVLKLGKDLSLTFENSYPMAFDSYYVSLLSETYLNPDQSKPVQYFKAILSGFQSNQTASKSSLPNYSSNLFIFRKP